TRRPFRQQLARPPSLCHSRVPQQHNKISRSLPPRPHKDRAIAAPCPLPEALVSVVARAACRAFSRPARETIARGTRCHPSGATASRRPL
ncbi:unnamed protein product, partial [Ectocarpus fasciculatus]